MTADQSLPAGHRDAFHCAAVLVTSAWYLRCGDDVQFRTRACEDVQPCSTSVRHGIVDPWGDELIPPGQKVWVYLDPGQVSRLTHNFVITLKEDQATALRIKAEEQAAADLAKNNAQKAEGHLLVDEDVSDPEGANRCRREGCGWDGD